MRTWRSCTLGALVIAASLTALAAFGIRKGRSTTEYPRNALLVDSKAGASGKLEISESELDLFDRPR